MGAAVGGVAVLVMIVVFLIVRRRRNDTVAKRRVSPRSSAAAFVPGTGPSSSPGSRGGSHRGLVFRPAAGMMLNPAYRQGSRGQPLFDESSPDNEGAYSNMNGDDGFEDALGTGGNALGGDGYAVAMPGGGTGYYDVAVEDPAYPQYDFPSGDVKAYYQVPVVGMEYQSLAQQSPYGAAAASGFYSVFSADGSVVPSGNTFYSPFAGPSYDNPQPHHYALASDLTATSSDMTPHYALASDLTTTSSDDGAAAMNRHYALASEFTVPVAPAE